MVVDQSGRILGLLRVGSSNIEFDAAVRYPRLYAEFLLRVAHQGVAI